MFTKRGIYDNKSKILRVPFNTQARLPIHTVNSNITKCNTVQSEEASPNIHVKATVEHTSGKHTVNSNITKSITH